MVEGPTMHDGSGISADGEQVPNETYVPDGMWEEERIMAERTAEPRTLDAKTLRAAVSTLGLGKPVTVGPAAVICDAVLLMQKDKFGCVLVIENEKLVGIFTERDVLLKLAGKGLDWKVETVANFMTPNPETLDESANLAFVLNVMTVGGFRHVPIVDKEKRPTAVVSMKDVVRYLTSFFEKEVQNLPPRPNLLHPRKRESG